MTEQYILTPAGLKMPKIIYGTAWKQERTSALVAQAIGLGFRGIDTACQPKHYHEQGVGEGITACIQRGIITRPELYLQTKFTSVNGQDPLRMPYDSKASLSEQVRQSFAVSLKNLNTTYLDCLVLHSPLADLNQTLTVWAAMENLAHTGKVKQLGISNCYDLETLENLVQASTVKPAVLQNRFYADKKYDVTLREFCKRNAITYQSFWTLTANPHIVASETLQNLAMKYNRTSAQVFFRYLTQINIAPLSGTKSIQHMQEDLAIFDFQLENIECASIASLLFA